MRTVIVYVLVAIALVSSCTPIDHFLHMDPPRVISFTPRGNTAPPDSTVVSVRFSQAMDTVQTENAFSLTENGLPVDGSFAWEGNTLTFFPAWPFSKNADYCFSVSARAEDTFGNSITEAFSHSFRTGEISPSPSLVELEPEDRETDVWVRRPIRILFNSPMDRESVIQGFRILPDISLEVISDADGKEFSFVPVNDLRYGTEYTVSLSSEIQSIHGYSLKGHSSVFTTEERPTPEIASVSCHDTGREIFDTDTVLVNSGIERNESFCVRFESPVPSDMRTGLVSLKNGPSCHLSWMEDGLLCTIEVFAPLDWGKVYELSVSGKIYRIEVSGMLSVPLSIEGIYLSRESVPEDYTLLVPYSLYSFSSESCFFDVHVRHTTAAAVSLSSFLASWEIGSSNGCVEIDSLSVEEDPVPGPPFALEEGVSVFRIHCRVIDNLKPGLVILTIGTELEDSLGNRLAGKYEVPVNR